MAMAKEMGMRRQHSTIMTTSPTRPSIIGRDRSSALEHLVEVDHSREGEGDRHEVHEGPVHDAEDVGGVAVAPDAIGLEPRQPGEKEHEGGARELDKALQPALGAWAEHAVDEIHHRVLV